MLSLFKKPVEVPLGGHMLGIYTFDGRPVARIPDYEDFLVTLIKGEHTMKSIYTGSTGTGNTALAYKGKLVGFLRNGEIANELVAARDVVGPLSLHALIGGRSEYGWPEIVVKVNREWLLEHGKANDELGQS